MRNDLRRGSDDGGILKWLCVMRYASKDSNIRCALPPNDYDQLR